MSLGCACAPPRGALLECVEYLAWSHEPALVAPLDASRDVTRAWLLFTAALAAATVALVGRARAEAVEEP